MVENEARQGGGCTPSHLASGPLFISYILKKTAIGEILVVVNFIFYNYYRWFKAVKHL